MSLAEAKAAASAGPPPRVAVDASLFARLGLIKLAERAVREHGPVVTLALPGGRDFTILSSAAHAAFWNDNPQLFFKDTQNPGSGVSMTRAVLGRTLLTAGDGEEWTRMRLEMNELLGAAKPWFQRPLADATARLAQDISDGPDMPLLEHCIAWATRVICEPLIGARALDHAARDLVMQLNASFLARLEGMHSDCDPGAATAAVMRRIAQECGGESLAALVKNAAGPQAGENDVDDQLRSVIGGMLAGSLHINALSLFWLLIQLAGQPLLQSRLRVEAERFGLGPRRAVDTPLAFACVRESQRLRPVMAFIERQLRDDIMLDGHALKAGQTVLFSPWLTQRDADVWDNPLAFDPARFLPGARLKPGSYFPFGLGARICPGMNVVNQQLTFALSGLLLSHSLALSPDTRPGDLGALFRINLEPRGPVKLLVRALES